MIFMIFKVVSYICYIALLFLVRHYAYLSGRDNGYEEGITAAIKYFNAMTGRDYGEEVSQDDVRYFK